MQVERHNMATHRTILVCAWTVLLLYSHSCASATSAVKHGQGIQSRPASEFSTLALDVDLDGSDLHLDLDQDLDQDSQIPLYELYTDDQGQIQVRRIWTETTVTLYQNKQHDSAFGIVNKRNKNGTVSTAMQGFILRGDQLYEAKSKQSDDSTREVTPADNTTLLFDLDLTEVQIPQLLQAIDDSYERANSSLDAELSAVKGETNQDRADIPSSSHTRRKRQTVTQDVIIDVVALVDYPIYYKWFNSSEESSESEKKQDALDNIFQRHAFIFNGVNLRYKSIGDSLPYTIHIKLSAIVVATTGEASPWTETRRQEDTDATVDLVDGYAAIDDLSDWAKITTSLPAYDHLMLFTGYNLTNASGVDTMQGLAWPGTLCSARWGVWWATSIVEELLSLQNIIGTSAHELGHGLSAEHDGISQGCKDEDLYIMSGSGNYSLTDPKRLNEWKFSNCSIKYFDDFIKQNLDSSKGEQCLYSSYNASSEVPDVGTLMPGQVYDADEQCRQLYGQSSYLCQNFQNWNLSMVCLGMWCRNDRRCRWGRFPARGTSCGDGMWCIDGQCQPNTSTSVMSSTTTTSQTTATTTTSITPTPTPARFTTPAISTPTTPTTATTTAISTSHTPSSTPTTTTTKKRSTPSRSTTSSSSTTTTTSMEPSSTMASMEHSSMMPTTPAATTTLTSSEATTTASLTSMTSTSAAKDDSGCLTSSAALLVAGCIASLMTYLKHFVQ